MSGYAPLLFRASSASQRHPVCLSVILVSPVVPLFSLLRAPFIVSYPVEFKTSEIEDGVAVISFYSYGFRFWDKPVTTPSIVFIVR
ncbi:hypothetical protein PILCRDRAFT_15522 [Piloderma croceum F 1598]|uniref:Uncharacterized protein n=1 Tax=Piloderma croceum (strain F 1598) TaxID=765440 RepID=A0A0C3EZD8_PILCF|nr:hypothetical protein PILCRDRAFT_15522 [Piloderma croceum F 1598]